MKLSDFSATELISYSILILIITTMSCLSLYGMLLIIQTDKRPQDWQLLFSKPVTTIQYKTSH